MATDNTTSLSAGNYILPNKGSAINASSLTQAQLQKIVGLKGVGVMTDITMSGDPLSSINNAGNTIQDPTTSDTNVKDKSYAEIPVSWTLGKVLLIVTLLLYHRQQLFHQIVRQLLMFMMQV